MNVSDRFRVYLSRSCLCHPCWCARCSACRVVLTKHNFTEDDAAADAVDALDTPGRWRHACKAAAVQGR